MACLSTVLYCRYCSPIFSRHFLGTANFFQRLFSRKSTKTCMFGCFFITKCNIFEDCPWGLYTSPVHAHSHQPNMTLASEIWAHMTEQGVKPTPEEYVAVFKGWASAGELERRVLDGSVDVFFRQLGESAFELSSPLLVSTPAEEKAQSSEVMGRKDGAIAVWSNILGGYLWPI